ncbi:hypothetical protein Tco_1162758 [Tanacetum coccineum]
MVVLIEEEPKKPEKVKRRDQGLAQIESDAELAQRLHEEEIDADHELAVILTHEEQEKYTIEERATLLSEYFERRKKQLVVERAEAISNKPPTRAQVRNRMITYLKHMGKYTHQKLNHKTLKELQKLYQKEQKWINDFKPIDFEEDGSNTKKAGKRIKRIANSTSKQKSPKKSKVTKEQESVESNEEAIADYEQENEELRMWLVVVLDEDETVDPEILSVKYPTVDWESQNLGSVDMEDIHVYKIIRADGNTSCHKTFSSMLRKFDRQDLMDLHRLVMKRFEDNTPEGYNLLLWGDLKILLVMVSDAGEDSSKNKIIARCGQTKEKLKDPSKGKQRSYKNFPSETSGKTDCPWRCYGKMIKEDTSFQCRSANTWALNEGEYSIEDHYGMVRSYAIALLESNVGSNVKVGVTVNPDDKTYFERFYVCFHGLKEGWKWFLDLLGDDLDIQNGHGLTLMSDQHKGLIEAIKEVMPLAASKASCPQIFIKIMDKINRSNPNARQYLLKKDLNTWSRAFFQEGSNCEAVENGFIECFNGVLLSVRHKPIITLLDSMRQTKDQQRFWHVIPSGGNKFEVKRGLDACKVDEKKMPGRPRKKRIRAPNENKSTYKISRAGVEMTFHNCVEKGHNKKGCKNEPIPQTPKVPSKAGRPKKKVPIDTTNLVDEDDIPRFMNTKIDEYDRAASSNNVVFNNGRRIDLGMNWNKNKCGKSIGNSYVKVRR